MTTNDHENYFRSNAALEMASQPIVVIDFLGDIMRYLSRRWSWTGAP